ncbi:MAG TPA: type II toxin-antitoxin system Phd/YefM family antitoxin [Terracidiphilus sp.]|jgi:prevent-host-death family protein
MATTTITSREFNQDTSRAKKAAKEGPVFITDRGQPAHVLLSIEEYKKLAGKRQNLFDLLAMPGVEDIDFEIPRMSDEFPRAADFE